MQSRPTSLSRRRAPRVGALPAVVLALVLAVTGCGAGTGQDTATTPSSFPAAAGGPGAPAGSASAVGDEARPSSSPAPATSRPAASPTARPEGDASPVGTLIEVAYAGGKVSGRTGRVQVALGEQVRLRVRSDTSDEVHVHGYDDRATVAAGGQAELVLSADIPGVFEVELEELGVPLLSLQVQ